MPVGDYVKTTYVNGGAPGISAERLNNNENKTAEMDAELAAAASAATPAELVRRDAGGRAQFVDPAAAADAATKAYVDAIAAGLTLKAAVRVATTGPIVLSGAQTIDGVACGAGDRVLVKNQADATTNGIYVVAAGAWSRAPDADDSAQVPVGTYCFVSEGDTNGDQGYALTTDAPITLGTTPLTFTQVTGAGQITAGTGLTKTGNTLAVDGTSAATAAKVALRDASGRAQFATPSAAADAATKGYVDARSPTHFYSQSAPPTIGAGNAVAGDLWYDTTNNRLLYCNGSAWIDPLKYV